MRPSEKAWLGLAAGIVAWELLAPDGELLSHAVDGFLETHPILTWSVVLFTAGHLLNVLPTWADPYGGISLARSLR